ncbi:MAG: hypothetical protein H0X26_08235 [Alphaproteobacteria bacterium]|nr:hypothetical protein [Alphaproteobacteria bacterium]
MKKKISVSLKLKVAIEALKGDMTIGEIASKYEISPSEIHRCKRQLLQALASLKAKNPQRQLTTMKSKSSMPILEGSRLKTIFCHVPSGE